MPRRKDKAFITDDGARKSAERKRIPTLLKNMSVLSTLCDIDCFVIIYNPDNKQLSTWPSPPEIQPLLEKFESISEMQGNAYSMDLESYFTSQVEKLKNRMIKKQKENMEMSASLLMHHMNQGKKLTDFNNDELGCMDCYMQEKMLEIRSRIQFLKKASLWPEVSLTPHQDDIEAGQDQENTNN